MHEVVLGVKNRDSQLSAHFLLDIEALVALLGVYLERTLGLRNADGALLLALNADGAPRPEGKVGNNDGRLASLSSSWTGLKSCKAKSSLARGILLLERITLGLSVITGRALAVDDAPSISRSTRVGTDGRQGCCT